LTDEQAASGPGFLGPDPLDSFDADALVEQPAGRRHAPALVGSARSQVLPTLSLARREIRE